MKKDIQPMQRGQHCNGTIPYLERWAERHPQSQEAVERDRLAKGFARHRAHLYPLTSKSMRVSA